MGLKTDLYLGDCRIELKKILDNSVDLIVTSQFSNDYCKDNGEIYWEKLVQFNSGITKKTEDQ